MPSSTRSLLAFALAGYTQRPRERPAAKGDGGDHGHGHALAKHVLLVSVDGVHQSDLVWYIANHPHSTLAALTDSGVQYSDVSTPFSSDSFPGMVAQVTGGNPSSTC